MVHSEAIWNDIEVGIAEKKNESNGVNSDTFCKDVLEVGTAEIFLKDETINYFCSTIIFTFQFMASESSLL